MKLPTAPNFTQHIEESVKDWPLERQDAMRQCYAEHFAKFDKMLREDFTGTPCLGGITKERVSAALAAGDTALNTIPLAEWDALSGYAAGMMRQPLRPGATFFFSDVMCALKHYARFYL